MADSGYKHIPFHTLSQNFATLSLRGGIYVCPFPLNPGRPSSLPRLCWQMPMTLLLISFEILAHDVADAREGAHVTWRGRRLQLRSQLAASSHPQTCDPRASHRPTATA